MSHGRRTNDRRRRVLYSAHQADHSPSTAASRREAERLREARRPPSAYGSRVHRRLRARWFSLVPVRRRTLILLAALLATVAVTLAGAHYASVAWPAIAYRPEIARPLRLDRPDSFGRWFTVALLAGCSGTSFLIYQLRRYRNDDFKGRYRLWRLVLVLMMLASLNSLVSIIDWGGALLDAGLGKRVALTGSDWIRLVVSLGGAVLALRLIAEVRRCRSALGMMLLTCALFAAPEAAKWNVLQVESMGTWAFVTSAPLLACTALFLSFGGYLRMLYREVRQIEDNDSLKERFQQMRLRVFQRSDREDDEADLEEDVTTTKPPRGRWGRKRSQAAEERGPKAEEEEFEEEQEADIEENEASTPQAKRRWFGLRRAKQACDDSEDIDEQEPVAEPPKQKGRRFSKRQSPPAGDADSSAEDSEPEQAGMDQDSEPPEKSSRGLGGWLRRKKKVTDTEAGDSDTEGSPATSAPAAAAGEDFIDGDDIDWASLSKSERRRLRKQLKRQSRAA